MHHGVTLLCVMAFGRKKGEKKVKKKTFEIKKKNEVGQLEVSNQRHSASEPILRRPARFVRS